jgi:hypothetical protein
LINVNEGGERGNGNEIKTPVLEDKNVENLLLGGDGEE